MMGNSNYVSPEMYGAIGDGITDDILALEDAIKDATDLNVPLYLGPKVYGISRTWVLPGRAKVFGVDGMSRIKVISGFSSPVVMTKNAPSGDYLTIADAKNEVQSVYLKNFIIDGSWDGTDTTSGYKNSEGLRVWGVGTKLEGIRIGHVYGVGANLGGKSTTSVEFGAPSLYSDLRVDFCGQHGIVIGGSSDNHTDKIIVRNAGQLATKTYDGIRFGGGGGPRADQLHVWQSGDAKRLNNALYLACWDAMITNIHMEGAAGSQIMVVGARNRLSNFRAYSQWADGAHVVLLNDANYLHGHIGSTRSDVKAYGVQLGDESNPIKNCYVDIYSYACIAGSVNIVNSKGYNYLNVRGDTTKIDELGFGSVVKGEVYETDYVDVRTPQYTGIKFGHNLNTTGGVFTGGVIKADSNIYGKGLVVSGGMGEEIPTTPGQLYRDTSGFVKVKI